MERNRSPSKNLDPAHVGTSWRSELTDSASGPSAPNKARPWIDGVRSTGESRKAEDGHQDGPQSPFCGSSLGADCLNWVGRNRLFEKSLSSADGYPIK
jgi:hypothetical protein